MLRMSLHKCMPRRLSHASLATSFSRRLPCMSLRGYVVTAAISCLLLVLVACGDDNSDFATRPSDDSSSSVCENCDDAYSSSSGIPGSSGELRSHSSSSRSTEFIEPDVIVNETCRDMGACDAMVKTDVSTWHFVRKDDFGDDAEYIYKANGKDLIVTIKNADGSTDSKTYSMYNMESEAGVEIAFNAAKSTCKDGGGNDNKVKSCVKDTVKKVMPECNTSLEGKIGIDTTGKKVICQENKWHIYVEYGSLTDDRDGQTYKIVNIGSQIWMAANLNYKVDSSFCYNDSVEYCEKYGRLYKWTAAVNKAENECGNGKTCSLPSGRIQGVCPEGWHLPSMAEWEMLYKAVGYESTSGTVLKSTSGWKNGGDGTDDVGFSALPIGARDANGDYGSEDGYGAYFWSSTERSRDKAYGMRLFYDYSRVYPYDLNKQFAFSVRCIKG